MRLTIRTKAVIALVVFVVVVVAACAVRWAVDSAAEATAREELVVGVDAVDEELAAVKLNALQKELLAAYDGKASQVEDILTANVWTCDSAVCRFAPGRVAEVSNKTDSVDAKAFVITEAEDFSSRVGVYTEVGWSGHAYVGDRLSSFLLYQNRFSDGTADPWVLECGGLSFSQAYILGEKSAKFSVEGLDGDVLGILGENARVEVTRQVQEYCALHYPAATRATWDGSVDADYSKGEMTLGFSIDEPATAHVKVVCSIDGSRAGASR